MKKKFLSLMMAAAVVATTSVSAFAAENTNVHVTMPNEANITSKDNEGRTHDIDITGNIQNNKGEMPTTSFKVTVPTAANFTVTNQGKLVGPELTVKNEGTQGIDVYAYDFSNTGDGSIQVIGEDEISGHRDSTPRTKVSLRLVVNGDNKAFLGASDNKSGIYTDKNLGNDNKKTTGVQLLSLDAGAKEETTDKIQIAGIAGKGDIGEDAVSDTFKLVLKIKKSGDIKGNPEASVLPGGVLGGR